MVNDNNADDCKTQTTMALSIIPFWLHSRIHKSYSNLKELYLYSGVNRNSQNYLFVMR